MSQGAEFRSDALPVLMRTWFPFSLPEDRRNVIRTGAVSDRDVCLMMEDIY